MSGHILVIDDDARLRDLLRRFLQEHGFTVETAANAQEAKSFLKGESFDAMILDVMMPGESGLSFAQEYLKDSTIPILMLTARYELEDKLKAFDAGVRDYLTKPFEPLELLARLKSILKNEGTKTPPQLRLRLGDFSFFPDTGVLKKGAEDVQLSFTEVILLKTLAQNPRHPFSREDLAQCMGHRVDLRTVDVQIGRLRKKIEGDSKQSRYIQTIRHIGYALCPD